MSHIVVGEELEECGSVTQQAQGVDAILALDACLHLLGIVADITKCHRFRKGLRHGSLLQQFHAHKLLVCAPVHLATVGAEPILAHDADEAESAVRHPCRQKCQLLPRSLSADGSQDLPRLHFSHQRQ